MSTPLVFIDCETTGLHEGRYAWEVAAIRREVDGTERHRSWFIRVPLDNADPGALRIGRFYDRHPDYADLGALRTAAQQPDYATLGNPDNLAHDEWVIATEIEAITRGAQLVGSNPAFDAATLAPMLRRHGLLPAWHYQLLDIVPYVAGYLTGIGKHCPPPWRSYETSEAVGVPRPADDVAHTAMGDALWVRGLYDHVVRTSLVAMEKP